MLHNSEKNLSDLANEYPTLIKNNRIGEILGLVVFAGASHIGWLRALRRGFRHCFLAAFIDGSWVVYDPLSHQTILHRLPDVEVKTLSRAYQRLGLTVVEVRIRNAPRRLAPIRPYTCVEATKRVLGLRAPGLLTPWQLFRWAAQERKQMLVDMAR